MQHHTGVDGTEQRTLREPVSCVGLGLHCGRRVAMTLRPADADAGVSFVRRDVRSDRGHIPAVWKHVVDTRLCTVLGNEHGVTAGTVEHLLAALRGCGVDNAVVELDAPEVPIMDGSAAPYVALIDQAGVVGQQARRRAIIVHRTVAVYEGDRHAVLSPARRPRVSVEIDFAAEAVGRQRAEIVLEETGFRRDVASARTFGFAGELEGLREQGLALGGSVRNAIVVDGAEVVNTEGLRFPDEFARHKLLDCVGDLSLAGGHLLGHMHGHKPGHRLNKALMRHLFDDAEAWSLVRLDEVEDGCWRRLLRGVGGARNARLGRWFSTMVA
jgi:UDP-3-O-[3-hydroxymyristoyl] N-acetylglucosamine deacetylase